MSTIANLVSLFAGFNCWYNIAKKFKKDTGVAVCAGIFSGIFVLIFGFSKNEVYDNSIPVSNNGVFPNTENENNYQNNYQNNSNYSNVNNENDNLVNNNDSLNNTYSFCGNCGTKLEDDDRFCPVCGQEKK